MRKLLLSGALALLMAVILACGGEEAPTPAPADTQTSAMTADDDL